MVTTALSRVSQIPTARSEVAVEHFARVLSFETDCWDVHHDVTNGTNEFVLLDVRSPERFASGHVPGAVNLPHERIIKRNLKAWSTDTTFVVYCAGPHCNGADRAALRLATLDRPVKKMLGGVEGWKDEGFKLVTVASQGRSGG